MIFPERESCNEVVILFFSGGERNLDSGSMISLILKQLLIKRALELHGETGESMGFLHDLPDHQLKAWLINIGVT